MTPEGETAVERAARAIVRQRTRGDTSPQGVRGPAAEEILDDVADDVEDWCRLARLALDRARELLGEDPEPEGAPLAQREPSTLEPISSPPRGR